MDWVQYNYIKLVYILSVCINDTPGRSFVSVFVHILVNFDDFLTHLVLLIFILIWRVNVLSAGKIFLHTCTQNQQGWTIVSLLF